MNTLATRLLKLADGDDMILIDDTKKAPAPKPAPASSSPNWLSDLRSGFGNPPAVRDPGIAHSTPKPAPAPASAPAPAKQPERFSPEAGDPGLNPRFNFWRGKVEPKPAPAPPAPKPPAKTASFAARLSKLADDTGLPVPDLELGLKERLKKSLMEVEQARPLSQGEYRARKTAEEIPHGHAALVGALAGGAASVLDPALHSGAAMAAGGGLGLLAAARHNKRQRDHARMKEDIKREIVEALPKTAAMLTLDDLHQMQDEHTPGCGITPEQLHEIFAKKYKQAAMGMNNNIPAPAPPAPASAGTSAQPAPPDPSTGPASNNMAPMENPYSSNMPAGPYGRPAASDATSSALPSNSSAPKSQETKFNVGTFKPNASAIS